MKPGYTVYAFLQWTLFRGEIIFSSEEQQMFFLAIQFYLLRYMTQCYYGKCIELRTCVSEGDEHARMTKQNLNII